MIFYYPKWNCIPVKITDMKSVPTLSFKHTCALITTSNESALIHFVSGKLCSHENFVPVWNFHFGQNDWYEIHTVLSLTSPQFMWTQVNSWLNTEVRFFNRNETSYRFEFISPLMWTYSLLVHEFRLAYLNKYQLAEMFLTACNYYQLWSTLRHVQKCSTRQNKMWQ